MNTVKTLLLIFLLSSAVEITSAQDSTSYSKSADNLEKKLSELEVEVAMLRTSKDYFTTIIGSQTAIFSVIAVSFIGITWIFSFLGMKKTVKKEFATYQNEIEKWKKSTQSEMRREIEEQLKYIWRNLYSHTGAINKIYSTKYFDEDKFALSVLFALRAATDFLKIQDKDQIISSLTTAREAVQKIGVQSTEKPLLLHFMDEISELLADFKDDHYNLYTEPITETIKKFYKANS